jgi:iron complex outermembrane receptor protein
VVGGNYNKEFNNEQDQNWNTQVAPGGSCPYYAPNFSPLCNVPNPGITGPTQHVSKGAFGQTNIHVTDDFKLTLGLRHSSDSLSRVATIAAGPGPFYDAAGNPCAPPHNCVGGGPGSLSPDVGSESSSKLTWRVGADYQLTPDKMVYVSAATGYKAGGFNDYNPVTHGTSPYGPEELTAYEVGFKGRLVPSLQFNTDFYYYDYSKYGLTGATFLTPNLTGGPPNVVIYTSLVPATLYGWESELNWSPVRSDLVSASVAFAKGHFDGGPDHAHVGFIFSNQIDWSHKTLDNTPAVSGTLSYEHRWFMTDGAMFSARIRSKLSSSYYESDLTGAGNPFSGVYSLLPQQYTQSAYSRTDLGVGYTTASGKIDVNAYVRNVEDKLQMTSGIQNLGTGYVNAARVRVTDPRTFGVRFGWKL